MLSREIDKTRRPHPETFALLTGLLDDPDPNVVAKTMGILGWLFHPAYDQAMRSRRDRFAHHENPKVREACRAFIDKEQEQAAQRIPEFPGEDVASLFASSFDAMRTGNGGSGPHLEALRHRDAADTPRRRDALGGRRQSRQAQTRRSRRSSGPREIRPPRPGP